MRDVVLSVPDTTGPSSQTVIIVLVSSRILYPSLSAPALQHLLWLNRAVDCALRDRCLPRELEAVKVRDVDRDEPLRPELHEQGFRRHKLL